MSVIEKEVFVTAIFFKHCEKQNTIDPMFRAKGRDPNSGTKYCG